MRCVLVLSSTMLAATVGFQIYQITHSTTYLAFAGFLQFIPKIIFMLFSGSIADKFDRRRIIACTQSVLFLVCVVFALLTYFKLINANLCLVLVFIFGTISTMEGPALVALLPNLVNRKKLPNAQSSVASVQQASTIIGPAFAGLLLIVGPWTSYLVVTIFALISLSLSFTLKNKDIVKQNINSAKYDSPLEGFKFIWKEKGLFGALSLDMFAVLFGGIVALLPVYATDVLHAGPIGYGVLRSSTAVGALLMATYLTFKPLKQNTGKIMFICVALFGVFTILIAFSKSIIITIVLLILLGMVDQISVVIRAVYVQLKTPDYLRGRVSAVNLIFIGASNQLGEFESGIVASAFTLIPAVTIGAIPATIFGGVCTLIVVVVWYRVFDQLRSLNRLDDIETTKVQIYQ